MARQKAISVKIATTKVIKALETRLAELEKNYANQEANEAKYQKQYEKWQKEMGKWALSQFSKATNLRTNYRSWNKTVNVDFDLATDGTDFPQEPEKDFEVIHRHHYNEMKEEFKKMSDKLSKEITSIINDPRYYEIYERIEIINIKGVTYVICTPKKDAKTKIEALKTDGLLSSGFEWLLLAAEAVGKAVVYSTLGVAVVALEVAKAMVNGVISAFKFLANGAMSLMSNVVYGLGQIGKWVYVKGAEAYKAINQKAEEVWKGFVGVTAPILKASGDALVAFVGAVGNYLKNVGAAAGTVLVALGNLALEILKPVGKALGIAWEGVKTLGEAAKSGLTWIAKKGKAAVTAIGNGIKTAYNTVVAKAKQVGSDVLAGLKSAGKAVTQAIGNGITAAGNAIASFGGWVSGLFESVYNETGNAIFESVRRELRLDLIAEDIDTDFMF